MIALKMAARNFLPRGTAFFNRIPIESLRFVIRTQCISVKNSSPPSLAQSSIQQQFLLAYRSSLRSESTGFFFREVSPPVE